MEFGYKTSSIEKGFFWRTIFVFFGMLFIWRGTNLYHDWTIVFVAFEVGFFIYFIISVIRFYIFYTLEKSKVIKLNDAGISSEIKNEKVLINWGDIEKVEWTTINSTDDFFCIIVKSHNNQIVIGDKIEDLKQIIQTIKSKVGNKFDTTQIPLELKRIS